jgi:ubiquinol-cytochrome c reductase core subunit 2
VIYSVYQPVANSSVNQQSSFQVNSDIQFDFLLPIFLLPINSITNCLAELREDNLSDLVHVALGMEGVSLGSKDLLASGVLSHAFGAEGPRIKYSAGYNKLSRAVGQLASQPALVTSFNANYSDTGLLGVHVIANKNDVGKVVRGVFAELSKSASNGLTSEELTRAK